LRGPRITLYLTFDGLLGYLAHSQVVRVLEGLARRGLPYLVVSLERAEHLAETARVDRLRDRLARGGVSWFPLAYDQSATPRAAASNLARAGWAVGRLCATRSVARLHARGYLSALVAHAVGRVTRIPYVFDTRSYWIDERAAEGRWFGHPSVYRVAKHIERRLFASAESVVTLTGLQEQDLREGRLGVRCQRVMTIPTCADFDSFRPGHHAGSSSLGPELLARLKGRQVLAMVGSLNASYHIEETYRLCRLATDMSERVHILVVSEQGAACEALLSRHGIPPDRFTIAQAPHEDMPDWLAAMDCAAMLLRENFAKRASMPTKLAEFFAVGVRPLHYGCNSEVADWVRRVGTGLVLDSLAESELARAARFAVDSRHDATVLSTGRERAEPHFSLRAGLDRYEALLRSSAAELERPLATDAFLAEDDLA
jgi:hypothetical protein